MNFLRTLHPAMNTARRSSRGFSLVEVLAAVAIIGIIVFIAIPNVVQARRDSEEQLTIARAEALNMATSQFVQANGRANAGSLWSGRTNTERYDLVKGYLAYAPSVLADFQPTGYTFTFGSTPDARVAVTRANGTATPDIINY